MEISPIFVDISSGEGLYSIKYDKKTTEFERLVKLWTDTHYVTEYCEKNRECFKSDYFKGISIDDAITKIIYEARNFSIRLKNHANSGFENKGHLLQNIFKPLDDFEAHLYIHQESKGLFLDNRNRIKPILRFYAVRIGPNAYVISGGAIKLVHKMEDHEDTKKELKKLKAAKRFLINEGYNIEEDLKIIL